MQPKKGIEALKSHWKDDLSAGFSVSLIALPLCLGIAFASGVPPVAGIITAIIGGLLASRISGSYITISGPAAGLIVITLSAVESLGGAGIDSGYAGYSHALGAIFIGGVLVALFGLLKVGKVGDFFPQAAVHGMLAAIGVIIIVKQIFPALGVDSPEGSIFQMILKIPEGFASMKLEASLITAFSILILVIHPMIQWKVIRLIPGPMWVLMVTIPLSFALEPNTVRLVQMPEQLMGEGGLTFPSFQKIGEMFFWIAVLSIALVSSIESLLSAKAVDNLDPFQRKSDLDKDLVAMGSGSAAAGLVGGLPMISEIVRSSANVSNGAKTSWSNFFHGAFLLIFLFVGSSVIEMIPVPALSAMLVYTGFKLAAPKEFAHMYQIGVMELEIFVVTLIAVLATDLIIGIAIGIGFKMFLLLVKGVSPLSFFKLHIAEGTTDNQFRLYLSRSLVFSNYLKLKSRMDKVLLSSNLLQLDFTDVSYIDHTVMVHLENYKKVQASMGKKVEFIDLEAIPSVSEHPFASRDRLSKKR